MVQLTNVPYFAYPAVAFNFTVWVDGVSGNSGSGAAADVAFQEISGIKVDYEPFTVTEGGEERFEQPLEVREIGIYPRVADPCAAPPQPAASEGGEGPAREVIVHDCVRRVLAILKTRQER